MAPSSSGRAAGGASRRVRLGLALATVSIAVGCGSSAPPPPSPPQQQQQQQQQQQGTARAELRVEIGGLESTAGRVALALFDSAESFAAGAAPRHRAFLAIAGERVVWTLRDLPVGDYAVKAFHDLDDSGELEVDLLGAPREPYGFSNGARGAFGPPTWAKARFRLPAGGAEIAIVLR